MLKDNFYKVISFEHVGGSVKASLELNAGHIIFEGHFPGTPVVPGVCMMQMVKEMIEIALERPLMISKAGSIKFLSVIDPHVESNVTVELTYNMPADVVSVSATLFTVGAVCFKFKGSLIFLTTEGTPG